MLKWFSITFHDHLCPFSMSFQYRLLDWVLNKSACYAHNMLINPPIARVSLITYVASGEGIN